MAELVFVSPAGGSTSHGEPPSTLRLLNHNLRTVVGADAALRCEAELLIVDARGDLAAARTTCQLLATGARWPLLLLAPPAGMSVITADWRVDDFISSEAGPGEFEARIRLALHAGAVGTTLSAGPVLIDEDAYLASVGGQQLDLTYTEFELLKYLVAHPGRVLTREQLLSAVWGYDYFGGTRTVDVHIRRLRAKLGPEHDSWINTVRNVGYRFAASR